MSNSLGYLEESVTEFRASTGLPINSGDNCDIETHKAVIREELIERVDGGIDAAVTLIGYNLDSGCDDYTHVCNILDSLEDEGHNVKAAIDIVHNANMSKLCVSRGEIKGTVDKYNMIGVETTEKFVADGLCAVYCDKTVTAHDGKFYKKGKLLKSINWHEPQWEERYKDWCCPDLWWLFEDCEDGGCTA